jgi:hypothetical protein
MKMGDGESLFHIRFPWPFHGRAQLRESQLRTVNGMARRPSAATGFPLSEGERGGKNACTLPDEAYNTLSRPGDIFSPGIFLIARTTPFAGVIRPFL